MLLSGLTAAELTTRLEAAGKVLAEAQHAAKQAPWDTEAAQRLACAEEDVCVTTASLDVATQREKLVAERQAAALADRHARAFDHGLALASGWERRLEQTSAPELMAALGVLHKLLTKAEASVAPARQGYLQALAAGQAAGQTEAAVRARLPAEPTPEAASQAVRRFLQERLGPRSPLLALLAELPATTPAAAAQGARLDA